MTENHHAVKVELVSTGTAAYVSYKMQCTAPEGAKCRLWCDAGCEEVDKNHAEIHDLKDQGRCISLDGWFDDEGLIPELYDGKNTPLRSGPIELHWQGEGYTWSYDLETERETLARTIYASDWPGYWDDQTERTKGEYLANADALLRLAGVIA